MQQRPVWAEVNLKNIVHNFTEVRRLVGPKVMVMAVVKANAYGHGDQVVAQALAAAGADFFGVAIINEAIRLRACGIEQPILVLGWTPERGYEKALQNNITLTVFTVEEAEKISQTAVRMNREAVVHIKVDTGMGRLGFRTDDGGIASVVKVLGLPRLNVEGVFTHLAKADEPDRSFTDMQLEHFNNFIKAAEEKAGHHFKIRHAANSAAVIAYPEAHFDLVRPGIMLYGLKPSPDMALGDVDLRQALSLRAKVAFVKTVPAGIPISYGGIYTTESPSVIATVPLGYADGYSRLLSQKAQVICHGQRAQTVGRICMDQFMFDATAVSPPVRQGDTVTLIGSDGENFISVDELARLMGTINYEVTCIISERVPRVYQEE